MRKKSRDLESRMFLSIHSIQIGRICPFSRRFCRGSSMFVFCNGWLDQPKSRGTCGTRGPQPKHIYSKHSKHMNCDSSFEKKCLTMRFSLKPKVTSFYPCCKQWHLQHSSTKAVARRVFPTEAWMCLPALQLGLENLSTTAVFFLICKAE